ARPLTTWGPGSKKRPGFPFEANPLPSWASFPLPNGISMHEQDGKMGPHRRNPSVHQWEEFAMRNVLIASCLGSVAVFAAGGAVANDELIKMSQNPKDWVMPAGDYASTRYSKLNQSAAANVGKLQVAWTFSTGVLRGHEGGPLIIGNIMSVHTPFPNKVYALDLSKDQQIVWKYEPKQDPNVIPVM